MRSHDLIDRRSLALHVAIASKIEANPPLLELARENLRRWATTTPNAAIAEWQQLLDTSTVPELLSLLRSPMERATRLRQSSPFAGVLTREERQAIFNRYEPRRA